MTTPNPAPFDAAELKVVIDGTQRIHQADERGFCVVCCLRSPCEHLDFADDLQSALDRVAELEQSDTHWRLQADKEARRAFDLEAQLAAAHRDQWRKLEAAWKAGARDGYKFGRATEWPVPTNERMAADLAALEANGVNDGK